MKLITGQLPASVLYGSDDGSTIDCILSNQTVIPKTCVLRSASGKQILLILEEIPFQFSDLKNFTT